MLHSGLCLIRDYAAFGIMLHSGLCIVFNKDIILDGNFPPDF